MAELRASLEAFERDLRAAGKSDNTVHTYVERSEHFLRYLVGEYLP